MSSRARRQKVRTFYPGGAHLKTKWCALLSFELVKVVLQLGRCHSILSFGFVLLNQYKYLVSEDKALNIYCLTLTWTPTFNLDLTQEVDPHWRKVIGEGLVVPKLWDGSLIERFFNLQLR